jgi:hypothetical protein
MGEVALRTSEYRQQCEGYLAWRPKGSVIEVVTDAWILQKWCEIVCDLASPKKRGQYAGLLAWDRICQAWTPALRKAWVDACRVNNCAPTYTDWAGLWAGIVGDGLLADMPDDPTGERPVYRTWPWSDAERRRFFIVSTDVPDAEIQSWKVRKLWTFDAEKNEYVEAGEDAKLVKPVLAPARVIDYEADLGLTPGELADIADPAKTVHPRFDRPVAAEKVKAAKPDAAEAARMVER